MAVVRDENGRFVKGAVANPRGRPPRKREERYYEVTIEAVTFDQWRDIVKKAAQQALDGDDKARKFLADYLIGEPEKTIELSGYLQSDVGIDISKLTDEDLDALLAIAGRASRSADDEGKA